MADSTHRRILEPNATLFAVLSTLAVSVGGLVEIVPMFTSKLEDTATLPPPYSPLELAGRDLYIREGCYNCHSQMIRPLRAETMRYGTWTHATETVWDHPFQLGSRRIGPDLQRIGGKYPNAWHYDHMRDPRQVTAGSIMPNYPWLYQQKYDVNDIVASVGGMTTVGVPYEPNPASWVPGAVKAQADTIVADLATTHREALPDDEIVALIAYLQHKTTP